MSLPMRVVLLLPLALAGPRYYLAEDSAGGVADKEKCAHECGEDAAPACIRSAAENDQVEDMLRAYADNQTLHNLHRRLAFHPKDTIYLGIGNHRKAPGETWNTTACPTGPDSNFTYWSTMWYKDPDLTQICMYHTTMSGGGDEWRWNTGSSSPSRSMAAS